MRKIGHGCVWVLMGLTASAFGDTLTLKNGNAVDGTYLGGTARELRMEVNGAIQTFSIDSVASLQFGNGGSSSSTSYQPPPPAPAPVPPRDNDRDRRDDDRRGRILRPDDSSSSSSSTYSPQGGLEIPANTQLVVRMIDAIDSDTARLGDTFHASLDEPVMVNGNVAVQRGADITAKLVEDTKSGKIQGRTVLKLVLTEMRIGDRMVEITTQDVVRESGSRGARSGKVIGGTAALGAIIGGIVGGGRGAAIGAGSGAAVGTGAQEVSGAQKVKIASETRLVFTLSYAVRV